MQQLYSFVSHITNRGDKRQISSRLEMPVSGGCSLAPRDPAKSAPNALLEGRQCCESIEDSVSSAPLGPEHLRQLIDDLVVEKDALTAELQTSKTQCEEAKQTALTATMKLEKAMAMVNELKSLKTDVLLLKQKSNDSEQQRASEITRLLQEKRELESKFTSF